VTTVAGEPLHERSRNRLWFPDTEALFMPATTVFDAIVRDAAGADAAGIAAIGTVAVPETYKELIGDQSVMSAIVEQSYALEALRDCVGRCATAKDAHFLVAEQTGRVVGFLHYDCEGPQPELHRIYVEPTLKRRGIGSALLQELHARLDPGASYVLMVVAANRGAVSFYERHGFAEVERVDGVTYMHERMGVDFPPDTPAVPALLLRFTRAFQPTSTERRDR
jgi:ribosomal protein S18 acetylase RimI-like enzyme